MLNFRSRSPLIVSAALTSASIALLGTIFAGPNNAAAQEASAAVSTQAARRADVYTMPSGDFASGLAELAARVALPILSPTPDTELLRLKQRRSDGPSGRRPPSVLRQSPLRSLRNASPTLPPASLPLIFTARWRRRVSSS